MNDEKDQHISMLEQDRAILESQLATCQARGAKLAAAAQVIVDWDEPYIYVERTEMKELQAALTDWRGA